MQSQLEKGASTNAMLRTTTALTIVRAGNKDNVLPGRAEAAVNFRILPGDTHGQREEHVKRAIANDAITVKRYAGQLASLRRSRPPTAAATGRSSSTVRELFPDTIVAPGLMIARHRFAPLRAAVSDAGLPLLAGAREARRPGRASTAPTSASRSPTTPR